ncbi:MAG: hypothetical protein FWD30_03285 [Dehalococcoidia bacterium]|nr:hypothetical protein [Dehalococcoidia bacterium]
MAKTKTAPKPKHSSHANQPEQIEPQPIPEEPEVPTPTVQSAIQPVVDVGALPTTDSVTAKLTLLSPLSNLVYTITNFEIGAMIGGKVTKPILKSRGAAHINRQSFFP